MFKVIAPLLLIAFGHAAVAEAPNLGTPLDAQRLAELDFTVLPDGRGLPPGSGSAQSGLELYTKQCLACHGAAGDQGVNDRLAGGHGSLTSAQPVQTIGSYWPYPTTVFDYVRRAMPYTAPGSLTASEVYALTAYLLFINGIIDLDMQVDATTLPLLTMPNAGNFVWAVPDD